MRSGPRRRIAPHARADGEVESPLKRIATLMCKDLNSILDFLRTMHKAELEDHYGRYRYICQRLQHA